MNICIIKCKKLDILKGRNLFILAIYLIYNDHVDNTTSEAEITNLKLSKLIDKNI